jgi:putative Flp pilus-assembly TadE/G-like protein
MKPRNGYVKGQIAVVMTFAIATLLGAMALGTDVAVMYFNWVQLQKAADAAALAGANYLGPNPQVFDPTQVDASCTSYTTDPKKAACTYAVHNGMSFSEITVNVPGNLPPSAPTPNIQVALSRTNLPYFFGRVIGLSTYSVAAVASAQSNGPVGTVYRGLFPAGINCTTLDANGHCASVPDSLTFGQKFVFGPGNWSWLNFQDGNNLQVDIAIGASVPFSLTSVLTKPGVDAGQVRHGFDARLTDYNNFMANPPNSTTCGDSYNTVCSATNPLPPCPGDPLAVVVPTVNYTGGAGSQTLQINGFAMLYLNTTQKCLYGSPNSPCYGNAQLDACFVKMMAPNSISSSGAPNLGATSSPILIQ